MSGIVVTPCWALKMTPTQKLVLISLADNASDEGFCFPKISSIMLRTNLSRRAVFRALEWLEAQGYIRRISGAEKGKGNKYIVDPSGDAAAPREYESEFAPMQGGARGARGGASRAPLAQPPLELKEEDHHLTVTEGTPPLPPASGGQRVPALPKVTPTGIVQVEKPETVDAQDWCDFIQACKNRRKPLTASRWKGIMDEAEKAGMQIAEVVALCARKGWASYQADYNVTPQQNGGARYENAMERNAREAQKWLNPKPAAQPSGNIIDVEPANRGIFQLLEKTQ